MSISLLKKASWERKMKELRQPICVFLGHVDHGKSSILEKIRGSSITSKEPGGITQTIKAYLVDKKRINNVAGELLKKLKIQLVIPGILFIDSPGHASFTSLRKRGGNIADIAVLVIDVNEGIMQQTLECIEILKNYKTPFVIALNKIDLIHGWRELDGNLIEKIEGQADSVKYDLEEKLYKIVGKLYEKGINADRYDRINDFTKKVAVIPLSARKQEGIPELLMVITGLVQKYLEENLSRKDEGKAVVLEISEDKNLGKTAEIILYEGKLKNNDEIAVGSLEGVIVTKVRGLFVNGKPEKEIYAAQCIKLFSPDIEKTSPGMPIIVGNKNLEKAKSDIKKEIDYTKIELDENGIIAKADSLGSLEALVNLLRSRNILIRKIGIGEINKKDILEAKSDELNSVIIGFNLKEAKSDEVKIITADVIYKLIDIYEEWKNKKENEIKARALNKLPILFKIKIMRGFIFRQSNPAVVGIEVLLGKLWVDSKVMNDKGDYISDIRSIQINGKGECEAERGKQVATAFSKVAVGRQINEDEILYSEISENDFRRFRELKNLLSQEHIKILKEIAEIKRRTNKNWGA